MKLTRFRIGLLAVTVALILGGIWFFTRPVTAQTFVTDTVKRGLLIQTVEVTGELKSVSDLSLSFETSGTLTSIFTNIGDVVKAGDVLAELNTSELGAAAEQARQGVVAAQADLDLKLEGISSEEEASERASLALAQAQFDAASIDLRSAVIAETAGNAQDAATVASSQSDYDQVAAQNDETISQAAEDLDTALIAGLITVRSGLEAADQILGVENGLLNIEYEPYVGILDITTISNAHDAFEEAMAARDSAEDAVLALTTSSTEAEVLVAYSRVYTALSFVSNTLLYTSRVLDASVSDSGTFSNADLVALRSTIAAERSTVSSAISSLISSKQLYDTALRQSTDRITDATNALALAQAQQDAGEASRSSAVLKAEASLAVQTASLSKAQALLNKVLADPRDIDVAGLKASIARAQADYDAALARLRKAQIIAPIDGIVTNIVFDVGEQVSVGTQMITEIAGNDTYEITLDVPEADISKLAVGQTADITFDAFGDRVNFSGSVYSLNPGEKVISDIVFYEAKVLLNTEQDVSMLKPGMSANVIIRTNQREDVLYVPTRTILERNGLPYIRVPKNSQEFDEVAVTMGLKADDGMTEVLTGVTEGQTVIVTVKTQ
ncbi:MAG: efflux RND transporter periplasmic adaptor subunit [Patescibacteria group bacterium]